MAFNINGFSQVGNLPEYITLQDGTISGSPSIYSYISSTDTQATISAANYFSGVVTNLDLGDLIYTVDSAQFPEWYIVTAINKQAKTVTITQEVVASGDVVGPGASTDNALVRWDGATGTLVQNGVILESDTGDLTLVNSVANGAGLIGTPSYTFTGDLDTGFWHSAANTVDVSTNGLRAFQYAPAPALSVNYIAVSPNSTNAANAALQPKFTASGTDAVIDVAVVGKGATGGFSVLPTTTAAAGSIKLWNGAGTFYTAWQSAAVASSQTYTTPLALPTTSGMVLSCTTAGVQSWVSNSAAQAIDQTTTPVNIDPATIYSANTAGLLTFNMPATAAFGDLFEVVGQGAGGWLIQMNAGQTANLNGSATSVAGSLASTNRYNCIKLMCTVANTTFTVVTSSGVITVA